MNMHDYIVSRQFYLEAALKSELGRIRETRGNNAVVLADIQGRLDELRDLLQLMDGGRKND